MHYDLTRPNTGRMIDYWLGGTHNFEVDRQLADQLQQQFPLMRQFCVDDRAFTGRVVRYFHDHGIRAILDFGSGLPTCDNSVIAAHALDPNFKIVCSDIDPITVAYSQEILAGTPTALYLQCNAAEPRGVLNDPKVHALLGETRRVGIIFNALVHFMQDAKIRTAWQTLYEWAAPGSLMSVSGPSVNWLTWQETARIIEMYKRSNIVPILRTREEYVALIPPWRLTPEGIADNQTWGLPPKEIEQPVLFYSMMLTK